MHGKRQKSAVQQNIIILYLCSRTAILHFNSTSCSSVDHYHSILSQSTIILHFLRKTNILCFSREQQENYSSEPQQGHYHSTFERRTIILQSSVVSLLFYTSAELLPFCTSVRALLLRIQQNTYDSTYQQRPISSALYLANYYSALQQDIANKENLPSSKYNQYIIIHKIWWVCTQDLYLTFIFTVLISNCNWIAQNFFI